MPNLEELNLSGNLFASFNDEIQELANLSVLNLSDCKLLDGSALLELRFLLPNTDLYYFDQQMNANIMSRKLDDVSFLELKEKYQYFLEGDAQSAYELGRYFDDRGDLGIAYHFYLLGANNSLLAGKAKGLINNLSIAEMYERTEKLDKWIGSIDINNWREIANSYSTSATYSEYLKICQCRPKDEKGQEIIVNACSRLLNINNAVLAKLSVLLPQYEQLFNSANQNSLSSLSNAETWAAIGTIVDNTGMLGNFTGLGTLAGSGLSGLSQGFAQKHANTAAAVVAKVEDMGNKMKEIQAQIAIIQTYKDTARY